MNQISSHKSYSFSFHSYLNLLWIKFLYIILVISMGFGASESRLALRSCNSDITVAVGYISRKREVLLLNCKMGLAEWLMHQDSSLILPNSTG